MIILGKGFVGSRFQKAFSESQSADCADVSANVYFDFNNQNTWTNLPPSKQVLITFPLKDLEQTKAFYEEYLKQAEQVFILSTAKCYKVTNPDEIVNEKTPLSSTVRNQCEEFLRFKGATILPLGLIHGDERSIEKWLREGRIKNGNKLVVNYKKNS